MLFVDEKHISNDANPFSAFNYISISDSISILVVLNRKSDFILFIEKSIRDDPHLFSHVQTTSTLITLFAHRWASTLPFLFLLTILLCSLRGNCSSQISPSLCISVPRFYNTSFPPCIYINMYIYFVCVCVCIVSSFFLKISPYRNILSSTRTSPFPFMFTLLASSSLLNIDSASRYFVLQLITDNVCFISFS